MQYYAKIGETYYRLFSIRNGRGKEAHNDYLKWSIVYDPIGRRKYAKEFTIHPHKIVLKTAYPHKEDLDVILYYTSEFANLVTLLKFVQPEWESLGVELLDITSHWNHPLFHLAQKYEL